MTELRGEALEERFLEALEEDPIPRDALLEVLRAFAARGQRGQAESWAGMLAEALAERRDGPGMLALQEARLEWTGDEGAFRESCLEALRAAFKDRLGTAFVEAAFEAQAGAAECLRRLRLLSSLEPGAFCYDSTWGFGVVRRLDDFYKKITIDFTRKSGHQLSFSYAAETLRLVGPEHLLAMKHSRGEELERLVADAPDEVVRIALRSYGPLPVARLQEVLSESVLEPGDWKPFWDRARKGLKDDPLVDIPAKRSEPIRLLAEERRYDDAWFARLAEERDPARLLELATELKSAADTAELSPGQRDVLAERLVFALRGAETKEPVLAARLLLAMADCGLLDDPDAPEAVRAAPAKFLDPVLLEPAMQNLAMRDAMRLVDIVKACDEAALCGRLLPLLGRLPLSTLSEAIVFVENAGFGDALRDGVRQGFEARRLECSFLQYLCLNSGLLEAWSLGPPVELLNQVVEALEYPASGLALRQQKQLRGQFEDREWMEGALAGFDERERESLFTRIRHSRGWDEASRRSVLARMVKAFPELEDVAARKPARPEPKQEGRFTSWRTYRRRQEQLRELNEVTIPENSREIGVARSYGDLRENFEYQAARDQQGLLMRRKAEWERDLTEVRGTDFAGIAADKAGMGTGVEVERTDGSRQHYWLLGEWDSDEALGIVSSRSELARRLAGARAGDPVVLPDDAEDRPSRVTAVRALDDAIRRWVGGE